MHSKPAMPHIRFHIVGIYGCKVTNFFRHGQIYFHTVRRVQMILWAFEV